MDYTDKCEAVQDCKSNLRDQSFEVILENLEDISKKLYGLRDTLDNKILELTGCRPPEDICDKVDETPRGWTNKVRQHQERQIELLARIFDIVELL